VGGKNGQLTTGSIGDTPSAGAGTLPPFNRKSSSFAII
jgi:hypothetical protein